MDLNQGDEVVAEVYDLSCNQLIMLLGYYRGTENKELNMGTKDRDLKFLLETGLLCIKPNGVKNSLLVFHEVSDEGNNYINNILTYTKEV